MFKSCFEYLEATCDKVLIFSAKYGIITPTFKIPWYEEKMTRQKRKVMQEQALSDIKLLTPDATSFELILGTLYREPFLEKELRKIGPVHVINEHRQFGMIFSYVRRGLCDLRCPVNVDELPERPSADTPIRTGTSLSPDIQNLIYGFYRDGAFIKPVLDAYRVAPSFVQTLKTRHKKEFGTPTPLPPVKENQNGASNHGSI